MIDLFRIAVFIRFYMQQYEFLKIRTKFNHRSEVLRLEIEDKERYNYYIGEIQTVFKTTDSCIERINHAIIDFLARRSQGCAKNDDR